MRSWIRDEHGHETRRGGGKRRVGRDAADALEVHCREGRPRIEPVPTEPQDDTADGRDRHVVTGWHTTAVPLELASEPRSESYRAGERAENANREDDCQSCR